MNKDTYIKELEENIIKEGVFINAVNALGHALGSGAGIATHAIYNAAKSTGKHLFGQDPSDPNYKATNDEHSPQFNASTYDPRKNVHSRIHNILKKSTVVQNDPNNPNYRPSSNSSMMQQINQQNAAGPQ